MSEKRKKYSFPCPKCGASLGMYSAGQILLGDVYCMQEGCGMISVPEKIKEQMIKILKNEEAEHE